jgi:hypothetical protein
MRDRVGAEQLQHVPFLVAALTGVFRVARTAPVGPTHAVAADRHRRLRARDRWA